MNNSEKYYLIGRTTTTQNRLYIEKEEWESLKFANSVISNVLSSEQKYEIMILNYEEFEKTLLFMSLKETLRNSVYDNSDEFLMIICKSVINIILSIKIYVEQYEGKHQKKLKRLGLESSIKSLLEAEITDANEYTFIRKTRNYISHYDLPLHSVLIDAEFTSEKQTKKRRLGRTVIPYLHKEKLLKSRFLKEKDLIGIADSKGKIDLRIPIRKTINRISSFHIKLREITNDALTKSESIIADILKKYNSYYKTDISFGKAVHKSINNRQAEIYFSLSDFQRIKNYYERNTEQGLLENIYIHNMIKI
jgi:hypothetical protein